MNSQIQAIEKEKLDKQALSKISLIAFSYFLYELNKSYKPNLCISFINLFINEKDDHGIEIQIISNDENLIMRYWNIEELIKEIQYLFILFENFHFEIKINNEKENKQLQISLQRDIKNLKIVSRNVKTITSSLEWQILLPSYKINNKEIELISIYLSKSHCFNFHINYSFCFKFQEIINLSKFSFILPTLSLVSEYFEKRVAISKNSQFFFDSKFLNYTSNLNSNIIYDAMIVFHKSTQINYFEISISIDRKIHTETMKFLEKIIDMNLFTKLLNCIGIIKIGSLDDYNFEKLEIKSINDHSIGIFLNINNLNLKDFKLAEIYLDILTFLDLSFKRLKLDNQFICPDQSHKRIINIYQKDIYDLTNNIIKMHKHVSCRKSSSNFLNKFSNFLETNISSQNTEISQEILKDFIFKYGFKKNTKLLY